MSLAQNSPVERHSGTTSLAPRIYEGGGPRSGRASHPPRRRRLPPQSRLRRASSPKGEVEGASHRSCPRIHEGGRATQWQGESSAAAAGKASSVTAAPCQLPQRGSRGRFAPFLPPAFMRGEGHAVAGGVPRSGGDCLLSHGCAVPAPPEGKPRELRSVPAPRIYEGGGPRSGRGSPPQRGKPPQSRLRRASSPRGEAEGASHRSPVPFNRELAHGMVFPERIPVLFRFSAFYSGPRPVRRSGCFFRWRRDP